MDKKYVVAFGNLADGHEFEGPFDTIEDAITYAENHNGGSEWWIIVVNPPEED